MENTPSNEFYKAILSENTEHAPDDSLTQLVKSIMMRRFIQQQWGEFMREIPLQLGHIIPTTPIDDRIEEAASALHILGLDNLTLNVPTHDGQKSVSTPIIDVLRQYKEIQDNHLRESSVNQTLAVLRAAQQAGLKVDTLAEPVTSFFTKVNIDLGDLFGVHERLLEQRWIEPNCTRDCFIYFFSGTGNPPCNRIGWLESNVLLALFVKEMTNDRKKWVKVCNIFELWNPDMSKYEPVKYDSIRANASNAVLYEAYLSNLEMVRRVIKGK